jgi:hypothetical protein
MELTLLADTGSPFAVIISIANMERLKRGHAPGTDTSFGRLEGGWLSVEMPDFGLSNTGVLGYANDGVVAATKESDQRFEGLAGLPFLRLFEFGGNADEFWIRSAAHV